MVTQQQPPSETADEEVAPLNVPDPDANFVDPAAGEETPAEPVAEAGAETAPVETKEPAAETPAEPPAGYRPEAEVLAARQELNQFKSVTDQRTHAIEQQLAQLRAENAEKDARLSTEGAEREVAARTQAVTAAFERVGADPQEAARLAAEMATDLRGRLTSTAEAEALKSDNAGLRARVEESQRAQLQTVIDTFVVDLRDKNSLTVEQAGQVRSSFNWAKVNDAETPETKQKAYYDEANRIGALATELGNGSSARAAAIADAKKAEVPAGQTLESGQGASGTESDAQFLERFNTGDASSPADFQRARTITSKLSDVPFA